MSASQEFRAAAAAGEAARPGAEAAWTQLTAEAGEAAFLSAWLAVLGRAFAGLRQATVLLDPAGRGPYPPLARWAASPEADDAEGLAEGAAQVIHLALADRQPALEGVGDGEPGFAAYPLLLGERLHGAVVVEASLPDQATARRLLRHLQWSLPWLEAHLLRRRDREASALARRATTMIEALAALLGAAHAAEAAQALAALLDHRLGCERVAVGRIHRRRARLLALSQSAMFDRRSEQARLTMAAMDEAADQRAALLAPQAEGALLAIAQAELSRANGGAQVLSLPLPRGEEVYGAITLLRAPDRPFTQAELDLVDAIAAAAGPVLADKWEKDAALAAIAARRGRALLGKLLGPRHPGLKAGVALGVLAVAFLALAEGTHRVPARGQVQGEVRRVITAPFDGFIRAQHHRAGDLVAEGALLAEMQDHDLTLDRLRHLSRQRQNQQELDRALARRDLAQVNIARAQVAQAEADIELADRMLARTRITAPFAGLVTAGDLSQSIGSPVTRGETLFELAPLDGFRLTLLVPEYDIRHVAPGQRGQVLLSALPERGFAVEVEAVTPVARAADGVNGFEVRARLLEHDPRIRPGMEGVAKLEVGEAKLAWIWTHNLLHWARVKLWGWWP
jgi:multidrug efflux pump subunit AcrA (membrane-fusion protein)